MLFGTAKRLSTLKDQRVELDQALSLQSHFAKVYRKASGRLRLLSRIRKSVNMYSAEAIYRSMVIPVITYCCILNIDLCNTSKEKLSYLSYSHIISPIVT